MGRVLLRVGPDGQLIAVKQVHAEPAEGEEFPARFRREAKASRKVSGACTAPVVDADPGAETPWLAALFVPGPSLGQVLKAAGPLSGEGAPAGRRAGARAGRRPPGGPNPPGPEALQRAARRGRVRVIGFGIVRAAEDQTRITHAGALVGSPPVYVARAGRREELTPVGDVLSLGATLVAACAGMRSVRPERALAPGGRRLGARFWPTAAVVLAEVCRRAGP
ncbi:hypothetical protein [Streptomyces sp. NPDC054849]